MGIRKGLLKRFTTDDILTMTEILQKYEPQNSESVSKPLLLEYLYGDTPMSQVLKTYHISQTQWNNLQEGVFRNRLFFGDGVDLLNLSSPESKDYRWSIINELTGDLSWIDRYCLVPSSYIYYNDENREVVVINHKPIMGHAIFDPKSGNFDIDLRVLSSSTVVTMFLKRHNITSLASLSGLSLSMISKLDSQKASAHALFFLEKLDKVLVRGLDTILTRSDQ